MVITNGGAWRRPVGDGNGRPAYHGPVVHSKARRHEPAEDIVPSGTLPFVGRLADGADCEAMDFTGLTLGPASAKGAVFLGCRLERCGLDEVRLDGARFAECRLSDLAATAIQAADTTWRDTLVAGLRVGAFMAAGSTWDLVRLRGVKANLLDLRGARLANVVLEDCELGELDLGGADVRAIRVERSSIEDLSVEGARLIDVDLAGAQLGIVRGIAGLRGATLTSVQLLDLSPQLAAGIGILIRD